MPKATKLRVKSNTLSHWSLQSYFTMYNNLQPLSQRRNFFPSPAAMYHWRLLSTLTSLWCLTLSLALAALSLSLSLSLTSDTHKLSLSGLLWCLATISKISLGCPSSVIPNARHLWPHLSNSTHYETSGHHHTLLRLAIAFLSYHSLFTALPVLHA